MRIVWLRGDEVHPLVGELREGVAYDVPGELARVWIDTGAAEAASRVKAENTPHDGEEA